MTADLEAVLPVHAGGRGGLASPGTTAVGIRFRLETLGSFFAGAALAYVPTGSTPLTAGSAPSGLASLSLAGGLSCTAGAPGSTGRSAVAVLDGSAYALGAFPACVAPPLRQVGTVIVAEALGATALAGLQGSGQSLSLIGPAGAVASVGSPPGRAVVALAQRASSSSAASAVAGDRFVSTVPLAEAGGLPSVSLAVTESGSQLVATRDSLDRTLLVIALGGTLLALVLAALTGDRITSGLRRLTLAAQDIRRGGPSTRSGIASSDEVGVLSGAFDAMVDSVEEKNEALRAAALDEGRLRARLEAVVAGMTDALVALDADGVITDFNRSAADLTGVAAADAIGRAVVDVLAFAGTEGAAVASTIDDPDGPPWSGTADVVRSDGAVVPVTLSSGPLRDPTGQSRGLVVVLRDLRAEQQVERMKTEFLSRVGHELRTPLTGILGYADMLLRRPVAPEQAAAWHAEIMQAAKRQLRIVRLLEYFASEGAGRVVLEPADLASADLVSGLEEEWRDRLPAGHRLDVRVADGVAAVRADRRWLRMAVQELVDNAVKFSPDGGTVTVSVTPGPDLDGRPSVAVTVADDGPGMSPAERETAFAEFVQGDPTDTRRFGGLGLGLSLVQRVVVGHGGTVDCESGPGAGTTIRVSIPAAYA